MVETRNDLDHLLIDLESNDSNSVATVLRTIYESNESGKFTQKLEARIQHHDQEIETMCSANYKSFIDCIQELLQVRPNAERLRRETADINSELMRSTDAIQRKSEELIKARRILVNSGTSIELLKKCLFVLEQYTRFNDQLQDKKYFPALKTLESLERDHLPTVADYRFAQNMFKEIPKYRVIIREASTKDLNDFLEGLLTKSEDIGKVVLRSAAKHQNFSDYEELFGSEDTSRGAQNLSNLGSKVTGSPSSIKSNGSKIASTKKRRAPLPPGMVSSNSATKSDISDDQNSIKNLRRDSEKNISGELNLLNMIDFSPVYRGLHIFTNLGCREQFNEYYKEQRQKQSRLAFTPQPNMNSINEYHQYFSSILGFFVIEDHLMGTTKDFISQEYLSELWQKAVQSMMNAVQEHSKQCEDASLMFKIKKLMMLLIFSIKNYGHNTDSLENLLIAIREGYNQILMKQWKLKFQEIFGMDNYHPLEVENNEEYLRAIGSLSFAEIEGSEFPKRFKFSSFVPKIYEEVRNFIEYSLKFSQDLNSSQIEVENMVRKSTNQLLTETLGTCLTNLINDSSLKLLQLIQITINTNYLEEAMQSLDDHITYQVGKSMSGLSSCYSLMHDTKSPTPQINPELDAKNGSVKDPMIVSAKSVTQNYAQVKLQGKSMFKDARADAESQIYRKLNDQVDEFLTLANYDWIRNEATGQASSFILDLIAWLRSTFQAFTNLPQRVAQGACMSACKHIAQSLRDMLLADEVKALSLGALEQLNLDLIQCEVFARSEPVEGLRGEDLKVAFEELRQLCDLFLYEDFSIYTTDLGKQQSKYLRVTIASALAIVEKLIACDKTRSVFSLKTEKQKLRISFFRELQRLQQQQSQQYQNPSS